MAYKLKAVRYKGSEYRILLQNENGPCPLLAACNALLLGGVVRFSPSCVRNGVASLDDVTNMLANQALLHPHQGKAPSPCDQKPDHQQQHDYFLHEFFSHVPTFQYGMDVNPSFTSGIDGYEWTAQLSSFDLLRVKLVHGWLIDPDSQSEVYNAVGGECYNALVERIIQSRDDAAELETVHRQLAADTVASTSLPPVEGSEEQRRDGLRVRARELAARVARGALIEDFMNASSHQLTDYGLRALHDGIREGELVVFFRNNHFGTLTKHVGLLYLLVTDLGYANTPDIVWEKLDVIDGDTELVNSEFMRAGDQTSVKDSYLGGPTLSPEQLLAQSSQSDADYHLALHLSLHDQNTSAASSRANSSVLDDEEGKLMAAATEESLRSYHGISSNSSSDPLKRPQDKTIELANAGTLVALPPLPSLGGESQAPSGAGASCNGTVAVGIPLAANVIGPVDLVNRHDADVRSQASITGITQAQRPEYNAPECMSQHDADRLLAMQLQNEQEEASVQLARKLQAEENERQRRLHLEAPRATSTNSRPQQRRPVLSGTATTSSNSAGCTIS